MINIFDKKTSYSEALRGNGLYNLDKLVITAETTEDISGNYELNMELELLGDVPTDLYESIQVDNIIKVNDEYSEELFRIAQVNKGLDIIEVYARHITIADSLNLWLDNVKPTDLAGGAALEWLKARTKPECKLLFRSNISKVATADYVRRNLYSALFEEDNAFIKRWGGEVQRRGYTITIDDKIGTDKSEAIKIKESLNLTSFNGSSNIDEISTVIYPVGFDGITADPVRSPLIDNYSMEFPIEIKYEKVKVKKKPEEGQEQTEQDKEGFDTLEEAQAELKRLALEEFSKNNIDKLQFTFDLDYVDLERFEEYKGLSYLQTADIGDTVTVRVDTFNMDIKARIVARKYDVLRGRRLENTLSTDGKQKKPEDIKDIIKDIVKQETDNQDIWEGLAPHIDDLIQQGFKKGYIVYEKNAVYAVDKLPKEQAKNVVVLNNGGLGHSSTGIKGPYKYGFTIDGAINASMITTGSLHGQYIGANTIEANKLTVAAKKEIVEGSATIEQFNNLQIGVNGLTSEVGKITKRVDGVESNISKIEQKSDLIGFEVKTVLKDGNMVNGGNVSSGDNWKLWDTDPQIQWYRQDDYMGLWTSIRNDARRSATSKLIDVSSTHTISIAARAKAESNTKGGAIYLIGSTTSSFKHDWAYKAFDFSANNSWDIKKSENISIPSHINYIWVRIDFNGWNGSNSYRYFFVDYINIVPGDKAISEYPLSFKGLTTQMSRIELKSDKISSTVEEVKQTTEGQNTKISKIEQTTNNIQLSVADKVGKNEIISSINISPERIKINAKNLDLSGTITASDLTDGTTMISGSNIKTGTIKGQTIEGGRIQGNAIVYIKKGGSLSCDGDSYLKYFRCDDAYRMSPDYSGRKVRLVANKYDENNAGAFDKQYIYTATSGYKQWLALNNSIRGDVLYCPIDPTYYNAMEAIEPPKTKEEEARNLHTFDDIKFISQFHDKPHNIKALDVDTLPTHWTYTQPNEDETITELEKCLNKDVVITDLIKEIQELKTRVAALEAKQNV